MPFDLRVKYDFRPVGQGLFSTGVLYTEHGEAGFRWVYDCGTTSSKELVEKARQAFVNEVPKIGTDKRKLDLVTISHFDKDHISGIVTLLSKFAVRTLLLPYIPLAKRLLIAFKEGADDDPDLIRFFVNPVAYLTGRRGADIERIIFVRSGSNPPPTDDVVDSPQADGPPVFPEGKGPWEMDIIRPRRPEEPPNAADAADQEVLAVSGFFDDVEVTFLPPGGCLRVAGCWEFFPYNDEVEMRKPFKDFCREVERWRDELLNVPSDAALQNLKREYDEAYGIDSELRNAISLFLYSGMYPANAPSIWAWISQDINEPAHPNAMHGLLQGNRHGIIYTGDGYLDTRRRLDRLINEWGPQRVDHTFCVQVMHHGAQDNWQAGLAKRFSPGVSVFSSDPAHKGYRHPHEPVVKDFFPYRPIRVNRTHGETFLGHVFPWSV